MQREPINFKLIESLSEGQYKKIPNKFIQYGTAGFRTRADYLDHVLFRMGILAVLRSQFKKAAIGLMITASHNPEEDNGVKLVDPNGEMLETSWEDIATKLANIEDDQVSSMLIDLIKEHNIDTNFAALVIVGKDTRSSSFMLCKAAKTGITAINGSYKDYGDITTPQLHYLVVCTNINGIHGEPPEIERYYTKISEGFKKVVSHIADIKKDNDKYEAKLQLDAANGVGILAMKEFQQHLHGMLEIAIYNSGEGQLNHECGADYVKIQQVPAVNMPLNPYVRCVSIDGDADRVVYYYTDENGKFHLLDGDRIATLVAVYFKELLKQSNLNLQLGLVQTAYANGASTEYITKTLKIPVACVPTGVKYLHHKAHEFDIGVYFEANGHGTVVFKDSAIKAISAAADNISMTSSQQTAAQILKYSIDVINQTVGDALSDMLLVELILRSKGWDIQTWEKCYQDLPNKQVKVKVQNRNVITTTDAERRCVTPKELQPKIDEIVSKYFKGRSFVRPSGTEDIVRIYAECETSSDVEKLAAEVSLAVYELAGGIGQKPTVPS